MKYADDPPQYFSGMIALVRDASGKPINIHRTFLTPEGEKAPVETPRKMMPGSIPKGGAVRLGEPKDALGVAEGIETAISAATLSGVPVWAAINDLGLSQWEPPPGVEKILIYADNDKNFVGQTAAHVLAKRLVTKYQVELKIPLHDGDDWNDVEYRLRRG
jgi:putative DNA primase/helicase